MKNSKKLLNNINLLSKNIMGKRKSLEKDAEVTRKDGYTIIKRKNGQVYVFNDNRKKKR